MSNESYLSVYAKSFSWAGFFLPKETFKKCSALYDFCRIIDTIRAGLFGQRGALLHLGMPKTLGL